MILGSGRNCRASGLTFTDLGPAGEAGLRPPGDGARTRTQSHQGRGWTRRALHEALPRPAAVRARRPRREFPRALLSYPATSCARSALSETPRNLCTHTDVLLLKDLIRSNRLWASPPTRQRRLLHPRLSFLPTLLTLSSPAPHCLCQGTSLPHCGPLSSNPHSPASLSPTASVLSMCTAPESRARVS